MDKTTIQQQIDAFLAAPALYVLVAVFVGGIVWWICSTHYDGRYGGQVQTLKERLSLAESQRDEFKSKLSVSSPDEARSKVDRLEGELSGLNRIISVTVGYDWRPLTDTQVNDLAAKLSLIPKHRVQIMYVNQLGKDLAQSFYKAFQKAGWDGATFSDGGGAHLGIIAGAGANKAAAIKDAIEKSTPYKVELDKPTTAEYGDLVYLFVGTNPNKS